MRHFCLCFRLMAIQSGTWTGRPGLNGPKSPWEGKTRSVNGNPKVYRLQKLKLFNMACSIHLCESRVYLRGDAQVFPASHPIHVGWDTSAAAQNLTAARPQTHTACFQGHARLSHWNVPWRSTSVLFSLPLYY